MLANNLHQLEPIEGLRSILVSFLLSLLAFFIFRLIFKNWHRAAVVTSIQIIAFFTYGHVRTLIPEVTLGGVPIYAHRYTTPAWILIMIFLFWLSGWGFRRTEKFTPVLNFLALMLVLYSTINGIAYSIRYQRELDAENMEKQRELGIATITSKLDPPPSSEYRDIYYIILDGYSRADILQNEYGFDNSEFIGELIKRGFFVAECSASNYASTVFSLGSSLNMDYFPNFGEEYINSHSWREVGEYLRHNVVRDTLIELGYKTVSFDVVGKWASVENSDYFITLNQNTELREALLGGVTEFEDMLMDSTLLARRDAIDALFSGAEKLNESNQNDDMDSEIPVAQVPPALYQQRYEVIKYNLEQLAEVPSLPGPKFVFAHILSTHNPFYFGEDGQFQPDQSDQGYINAIIYTNSKILNALDKIMVSDENSPIIIIQGDHSRPGSNNPYGILNAYFLPDGGNSMLYPTITPVNSYRVIFNYYFGSDYLLLEDYSNIIDTSGDRYQFNAVVDDSNCSK